MLLRNGTLKTYKDLPHGCAQTHPDIVNADLLAFIRGEEVTGASEATTLLAEPVPAE
jgi:non-heme chloroperoxidase